MKTRGFIKLMRWTETENINIFVIVTIIKVLVLQLLIISVNSDRGSYIGCYQQNLYFIRQDIFSGSSDVCISACAGLYYR